MITGPGYFILFGLAVIGILALIKHHKDRKNKK